MAIKQQGGIFGRNPTFNNVDVEGSLTIAGSVVPDPGNILVDADLGVTVQPYDVDTAKLDVAQTFTATQRVPELISDDGTHGRWTITQAAAGNQLFSTTPNFSGYRSATLRASSAGVNMTWDTAGNVVCNVGNLVIGTSGKGIDFSATAGTGTSELFDDYEEGTWTPTFGDWTTAPTVVYANYTKIGNQVTVTMYGYDGITNYSSIGGLPFAAASNAVGAGIINSASSYSIRAGCSVLASATALSGIEAGNLTGVYWQLCATYFA